MTATDTAAPTWTAVCGLTDLVPERGAAALLERADGSPVQVAVFRLLDDAVHAVQQLDPYSGANVMSRGIVGTRGGEPTVASPVYKQVFALRTGECLESGGKSPQAGLGVHLESFPAEVRDGVVHVRVT
ncbi:MULTISPECIES: nitrite reductase small subunit NirD [unclassified Isoptericola]|uniref:nitrite reductase small subunit NirD n=1 Tax=unclassified Isoptericola TaxID=2623355 RepID=UPI00271343A2|nr:MULTISPECIES: nitrite reductase small subunit NirD [unclassified Isoptericola]MDO8142987.1 nitrite reductase small subunit NirD [Isoptericola sp. 178]MDO8146848.1 nitrite reductase small subunit NirD [Isoptericola sp. b515]MDO8150837.1 nitrite reductase small subunit NirD [Isoptericola sp. b408]